MPRGPRRGAFLRSRKPGRLCDCGFSAQGGRASLRPLPGDRATDGGTRPSAKTPPRLADRRGEALAPWHPFSWPLWRQLAKFGRLGSRLLVTRPPALEQRPARFPRRPLGVHALPPGPPSSPSSLVVGYRSSGIPRLPARPFPRPAPGLGEARQNMREKVRGDKRNGLTCPV